MIECTCERVACIHLRILSDEMRVWLPLHGIYVNYLLLSLSRMAVVVHDWPQVVLPVQVSRAEMSFSLFKPRESAETD